MGEPAKFPILHFQEFSYAKRFIFSLFVRIVLAVIFMSFIILAHTLCVLLGRVITVLHCFHITDLTKCAKKDNFGLFEYSLDNDTMVPVNHLTMP